MLLLSRARAAVLHDRFSSIDRPNTFQDLDLLQYVSVTTTVSVRRPNVSCAFTAGTFQSKMMLVNIGYWIVIETFSIIQSCAYAVATVAYGKCFYASQHNLRGLAYF